MSCISNHLNPTTAGARLLPDESMSQTTQWQSLGAIISAARVFDVRLGLVTPFADEETIVDDDIGSRIGEPWKVILFNDDIHTFDEVIMQLQKALGCGAKRAEKIAFEAHTRGKAIAFDGEFPECFRVAGVLREIQLIVEIEG